MIWFACSQCNKTHGRPESSIGSLIFCECGQGNTVPWESTVDEPPGLAEPAEAAGPPPLPPPPRLEPIPVGEERIPVVRRPEPRPFDEPRRRGEESRRRPRPRLRDPEFCFNHQTIPSEVTCVECEEKFCKNCVIRFQNNNWCGPCKNTHIKRESKPPRLSIMAMFSLLGGMAVGPVGFCLLPFGTSAGILPLIVFGFLVQVAMAGLGLLALYKMRTDPTLTGKSLAVTGVAAAAFGALLLVVGTMYSFVNWV